MSMSYEALRMATEGMYLPETEHDACGVGFVASIDGLPRREVVEKGIEALGNVWHRGAVDADGKTGDGAGLHLGIPTAFFDDEISKTGHQPNLGRLAIGQIFLPRTNFAAQEECRTIVESEVMAAGYALYGWRHVPVNALVLGEKANATRPEIAQIMIANPREIDDTAFERELYLVRRRIEKNAAGIAGFYICSLSCRSLVYKGMVLAEQVAAFYPDLQDPRFESSYILYHQRYSTNTFPQWWLAQPFRTLAHNGEINTFRGNFNWMRSHEIRLAHEEFSGHENVIRPVIPSGASDSAALDSAFELLVRAGRDAPMSKTLLIPEAWSQKRPGEIPDAWCELYKYSNAIMEPWDGPAALVATDGNWVIAGMDRNGLRPIRYQQSLNGLVVVGSESGMVKLPPGELVESGRLGPGQMLGVDLVNGRLCHDAEIKDTLSTAHPYSEWTQHIVDLSSQVRHVPEKAAFKHTELRRRQLAAGYTIEELESILHPMVEDAREAIGSMGDDAPLAVLSKQNHPLSHFFRQNFSQVTNPPIDPLRERRVMSLNTRFGNLKNVLEENVSQSENLLLDSPVLLNGQFEKLHRIFGEDVQEIDCLMPIDGRSNALREALQNLRDEAEDAIRAGIGHLVLTDERANPERGAAIPMILATSTVHSWLVRHGLRTFCSINVRSAECLDPHYFAVLIGCGATTVNAYLAQESIAERHNKGLFGNRPLGVFLERYREAVEMGLLKTMSKMGIAVISSYRGGYNFEAVGLSRALVAEYFPGMASRISGVGLTGIEQNTIARHAFAFGKASPVLPIGGRYKARASGEAHAWDAYNMHLLQTACAEGNADLWRRYTKVLAERPPVHLRDLLDFRPGGSPVPLREVESVTAIRKRFVTSGMSLGALSSEAHETLSVAMNRIGAKSDSGEGGESPEDGIPRPNGDNRVARIKQIASGRFGVTMHYLNACSELEIKIAQGAKPGEGGQLPGFKVTEKIARLRHSTPGVMLISPPPHHDIYSIEDLAQLIYDLKQANPDARVTVKLVASTGVGTIAAGVVKAKADIILISGHNGGTGASPQTSIKYTGLPWEMGLTEAHQVLTINQLRDRVILRADGSMRTGRDVVMAAMMGAEEYGVGTAALVAMGCLMVRQCHSNTCPVGICTQDPRLREKFVGTPEKVVNFFTLLAGEIQEILARLGVRSIDEIIGRTDLLAQVSRGAAHLDDLDLNPLLARVEEASTPRLFRKRSNPRAEVPDTLDTEILRDAKPFLRHGEKMQLSYTVRNTQRAIGTRISSHIARIFENNEKLQDNHLTLQLEGTAGQSLGAFAVRGLRLEVFGEANDYVGKGLSGATLVIRPPRESKLVPHENTIIGNTVLYGATSGKLFANGQAGERFAVRNSGADAVAEGCGANGCEYMTGGAVVLLGTVGPNFAAGMTGGMAYVYDQNEKLTSLLNG